MKQTHWLDNQAHVKQLWRGFMVVLALCVLAGFFIDPHPHFPIESLPGFSAWYGFGTCALMILFAKALALLVKRRDTYYDETNDE